MCKNVRVFFLNVLIVFSVLMLSVFFVSCGNLFNSGSTNPSGTTLEPGGKTVATFTIYGRLSTEGALPPELVSENRVDGRTAIPVLPAVTYVIEVHSGNSVLGESDGVRVQISEDNKSYSIGGLKYNTSYTLSAKACIGSTTVLVAADKNILLNENSPEFEHDFELRPLMNGTGNVSLEIYMEEIPEGFSCEAVLTKSSSTVTLDAAVDSSASKITLTKNAISSGIYSVVITFFKIVEDKVIPLYIIDDMINVCDGLTTGEWMKNGNVPHLVPSGSGNGYKCQVTSSMMRGFLLTNFYVDGQNGSDTAGDGSYYAPFKTVGKVLERIKLTDLDSDFTVRVSGTVNEGLNVSTNTVGNTLRSLTISGASAESSKLDATGKNASVLAVSVDVPVTLEKLTLTGGNVTGNGGGINVASGADVKLVNCLVTGNEAGASGGGVFNAGTITLTNTTVVENVATTGGGIYNGGTLNVSGEIVVIENTSGNVYLPENKVIIVDSLNRTSIGVSVEVVPVRNAPVTITSGYRTSSESTTFTSDDDYIVKLAGDELILAVTGGDGTIRPILSDNISISCDKNSASEGSSTTITFTVKNDGTEDITDEVKDTFGFTVRKHGSVKTIPTNCYSKNANKLTLYNNLPVGIYDITARVTYNGMEYTYTHSVEVIAGD